MSATTKEVIKKYLKKVKPLYQKLSQKQQQQRSGAGEIAKPFKSGVVSSLLAKTERSTKDTEFSRKNARRETGGVLSHSFSGNLRYLRRKSCVSSYPSSMRSSPSHSGVFSRSGFGHGGKARGMYYGDSSSMEELQNAIQGAITHCKNSLIQNKTMVSNEI